MPQDDGSNGLRASHSPFYISPGIFHFDFPSHFRVFFKRRISLDYRLHFPCSRLDLLARTHMAELQLGLVQDVGAVSSSSRRFEISLWFSSNCSTELMSPG